jgi:hypothetical protein
MRIEKRLEGAGVPGLGSGSWSWRLVEGDSSL